MGAYSGWDFSRRAQHFSGQVGSVREPRVCGIALQNSPRGKERKDSKHYRVEHLVASFGWVDFVFGSSPVCMILLRQMRIRQCWHSSRAKWWTGQDHCQPNQGQRPDAPHCRTCVLNRRVEQFKFHPTSYPYKRLTQWLPRRPRHIARCRRRRCRY